MGRRAQPALSSRQAAALGLLQGPAELLPVSSSAHIALMPWLLHWRYSELDPEVRKGFEVALHAGTAAALLLGLRHEVEQTVRELDRRRVVLLAVTFAPSAVLGYALERPIERRLGTPATIAVGLLAGSVAMAAADHWGATWRRREQAGAMDGLVLGLAQATALVPGVSRNGATLAAARALGFDRVDANALSRHAALPVIAGATLLKTTRLAARLSGGGGRKPGAGSAALPPGIGRALAIGAGSAFTSTMAFIWLIRQVERDRSLIPYAAYRSALAGVVVWRLRREARE